MAEVGLGQEAQVTGVDGEDRHADRCRLASGREHGAIAAEHQGQAQICSETGGHAGGKALGAQVLVGVGEAHHAAGATHPHHLHAGFAQAGFNGVAGGDGQVFAVIHDQSNAGHRSRAGG